jgi:hypothetical protein
MRIPFGVAALLLAAGIARADVVIIQQIDGMAQSGQMTIMVNGDKVRADVSPQISTITDATGKTDKINGYNAAEYTFTNGNMKGTYWICSDFPNAKLVTDALAKFQKGGLASIAKGLAPDLGAFHGVPVKTEIDINGQKITTQLISANEQPVDPDEYKVPAGYTEMKMPPMDGPGIDF